MIKKGLLLLFLMASHATAGISSRSASEINTTNCMHTMPSPFFSLRGELQPLLIWCVPQQKPAACPQSSWDILQQDKAQISCGGE